MEKKEYPIQRLVNWYFANYCVRKCFDKDERLIGDRDKLFEFAKKSPNLKMTHREFLEFFNTQMKLCTLEENFKRKYLSWRTFVNLQDTPNYDSDKIVLDRNKLRRVDGELEKPQRCRICVALNVPF